MVLSFNQQEFRFSNEIPADLTRYLVPGYTASAITNEYLKLLVQEFQAANSKVYYAIFLVDKKSSFRIRDEGPFLITYLALQHDRHLEIEGLGKVLIKEGQYNIVYAPRYDVLSAHEDGKDYITLAIQYDLAFLQGWASYFPALAAFLKKVEAGQPAVLLPQPEWMTKEIQDTVYKIMHPTLQEPSQQVYFDLLVKTLLFHLLYQSVLQRPASNYTHYEVEGIQAAGEMIRKNLRYHFIIRDIAQKVGMNEYKLKNGFRELFGNGVYEYLRTERMQEARALLVDHGRSIKEIAALTGYRSVNSFIKAFKKKFGQTPGEFRKRA